MADIKDNNENIKFFGKVTAGATHEITNVLSIINELNGLVEDQIFMAKSGKELNPDKLDKIREKLDAQVQRGRNIIKNLNTFSHTVDSGSVYYDFITLLKNLVSLTQRFAALKFLKISGIYDIDSLIIKMNPFDIHKALFNCLNYFIGTAKENTEIELHIYENDGFVIKISVHKKEEAGNDNEKEIVEDIKNCMLKIEGLKTLNTQIIEQNGILNLIITLNYKQV